MRRKQENMQQESLGPYRIFDDDLDVSAFLPNLYDPSSGEELSRIIDDSTFDVNAKSRPERSGRSYNKNKKVTAVSQQSFQRLSQNAFGPSPRGGQTPQSGGMQKTMQSFLTSIGQTPASQSRVVSRRESPGKSRRVKQPITRMWTQNSRSPTSMCNDTTTNLNNGRQTQLPKKFKTLAGMLNDTQAKQNGDTPSPSIERLRDDGDKPCVISMIIDSASKSISPHSGRLLADASVQHSMADPTFPFNRFQTRSSQKIIGNTPPAAENIYKTRVPSLATEFNSSVVKPQPGLNKLSAQLRSLANIKNKAAHPPLPSNPDPGYKSFKPPTSNARFPQTLECPKGISRSETFQPKASLQPTKARGRRAEDTSGTLRTSTAANLSAIPQSVRNSRLPSKLPPSTTGSTSGKNKPFSRQRTTLD